MSAETVCVARKNAMSKSTSFKKSAKKSHVQYGNQRPRALGGSIIKRKQSAEALTQIHASFEQSIAEWPNKMRLFIETLSHLREGVMITEADREWPGPRIVFVNDAMCRITGYNEDELVGKTPQILQGEATDRMTLEKLETGLATGRTSSAELINIRKDGTLYYVDLSITQLIDTNGQRTNYVSIHRDITARKQADEKLRSEHELSEGIINTTQQIVLFLDTEGRIVRFNKYMEDLTGWRLDEVKGRDWFETFLPDHDRDQIRKVYNQSLCGERTRANVNPIITRDGRKRDIEWYDAPLTNPGGELIGLICTGVDITERKWAEQSLRLNEERMRAILNTATDAIITIDIKGIIASVNPATQRIFGYTEAELLGSNISVLMIPAYRDEHDGNILRFLLRGEANDIGFGHETTGRRKDGSTFAMNLYISRVEQLGLFTGIIRDISDQKELQKQVLESAAEEDRLIGHELHDGIQQESTCLELVA